MIRTLLAMTIVAALLPAVGRAAVFSRDWKMPGDGLLTYDDVNRREWLDLTESRLSTLAGVFLNAKYQTARAELSAGGRWAGFAVAKSADLIALAMSAGIDTSTDDYTVNEASTRALISLVGRSLTTPGSANLRSMGVLDETGVFTPAVTTQLIGQLRVTSLNAPQLAGLAPAGFTDFARSDNTGIWLYREIPEPTSLALQVVALWRLYKTRGRK